MVQIQRFLQKTNSMQYQRDLPMLNSLFVDRFSEFASASTDNSFKNFMKWARKSPQLMGFLNVIATDMLSDNVVFTPVDEKNGRNRVKRAKAFWSNNKGLEVTEETLYDALVTGIGYNWIGKIKEKQFKEFVKKAIKLNEGQIEKKELEFKANQVTEDVKLTSPEKLLRKLRHVASSTMSLNTDGYDVTGYVQRVGGNMESFDLDEIIEFRLMPFDGKLYPFPPMEAIFAEVYLLWLITQNYVSFFENGGKPDNVFVLPKEIAGSKNHEYLIDTLKKYKKIQNKHGNLVFTGDLSVEKLAGVEDKMENKDLGLYLVSVLAMMYGVPVSRLPFLVGTAANKGDAGGLADSGYWRKISVWQSKFEEPYNRELWRPFFGVEMKFKRGYLQDEVRETTNEQLKTQIAEQRMNMGLWDEETAGKYLNIDPSEVRKGQNAKKKRSEDTLKSGMLNQNVPGKDNVLKEEDARKKASDKQKTQNNNKLGNGKNINI